MPTSAARRRSNKLEASDEKPTGKQRRKPPPDEIYEEVELSSLSDLIPGDCVYFLNFADYKRITQALKRPGPVSTPSFSARTSTWASA